MDCIDCVLSFSIRLSCPWLRIIRVSPLLHRSYLLTWQQWQQLLPLATLSHTAQTTPLTMPRPLPSSRHRPSRLHCSAQHLGLLGPPTHKSYLPLIDLSDPGGSALPFVKDQTKCFTQTRPRNRGSICTPLIHPGYSTSSYCDRTISTSHVSSYGLTHV